MLGSDSLRLMGAGSLTAVSMFLKAFSLSLNLLSGLIVVRTGVVSLLLDVVEDEEALPDS